MAVQHNVATTRLFLGCMGVVYLCAFASLYVQVPGLYGVHGLTPAHNVITEERYNGSNWSSLWQKFAKFPTLLVASYHLSLNPAEGMELCCLLGVVLSLAVISLDAARCSPVMFGLWLLYLSLYKVGQVFLGFQWDILLLEAGFLAILLAPLRGGGRGSRLCDGVMMWLVRWLLFRLMFASGIVKLMSHCPTWWGLTALHYHYESQCIPTPVSWYAHQLPGWFQQLCVVGTYYIEIVTPLMFFAPLRSLRLFSCACQLIFQASIIMTGNYNFFNLLTITLTISLLDDQLLTGIKRECTSEKIFSHLFGHRGSSLLSVLRKLAFLFILAISFYYTAYYFQLHVAFSPFEVSSKIGFSKESFGQAVTTAMYVTTAMGAVSLAVEILSTAIIAARESRPLFRMLSFADCSWFSAIAVIMFSISLVSHGRVDPAFSRSIPSNVHELQKQLDLYELTHAYGLFRQMTGVGGRPELVIEGTNDLKEEWKEYDFLYKPGDVGVAPPFVAPHQPRLDWQMWFAALGTYQRDPWIIHLMYRLLIGQKEVMQLLAPPPFAEPPRYLRASLYHYHYTQYNHSESLFGQSGNWWRREYVSEYVPVITRDAPSVEEFLKGGNYLTGVKFKGVHSGLAEWLLWLRTEVVQRITPTLLILALLVTIVLIKITTRCVW